MAFVLNPGMPPPVFIDTEDRAKELLRFVMKHERMAIDTETTGLDIIRDFPVYWSLSEGKHRWCILAEFMPVFQPFFEDEGITKLLTNAKYDKHMVANAGFEMKGDLWDTIVMDYLLDVNQRHGLKECVKRYGILGDDAMPSFASVFLTDPETGKRITRKKGDSLLEIHRRMMRDNPTTCIDYASQDAWATWELTQMLRKRLERMSFGQDWTAWDHYLETEVPFTKVLWRCERRGITLDVGYLEGDLAPEYKRKLERMERNFAQSAGHVVNLRSPKQLRELFYEYDEDADEWYDPWGEPCKHWTSGGASGNRMPATNKVVLEKWAERGLTLAQDLLDHRGLAKNYDTYAKQMPTMVDNDLRIHTTLNQAVTATGRLSSTDPNLQNIPVRTEEGRRIREAFVAAEGRRLLVLDYSQLEMRILAHLSGDQGMIDAINNGMDIHCDSASRMFGRPYSEYAEAKANEHLDGHPTPDEKARLVERGLSKNGGFLIVYGGGAGKLATTAGIPVDHAKQVIENFLDARPGIRQYADGMKAFARQNKFVRTLVGRYRHLPFIDSYEDHGASERAAVNTPIQGTAADIAKAAMLKVDAIEDPRFREAAMFLKAHDCQLLLQVHDELIFEIPDDDEVEAAVLPVIKEQMENPFKQGLAVPLPVDGGSGYSWVEAK